MQTVTFQFVGKLFMPIFQIIWYTFGQFAAINGSIHIILRERQILIIPKAIYSISVSPNRLDFVAREQDYRQIIEAIQQPYDIGVHRITF